jgi:phosphonate transport system substrate-binding protein
LHLENRTPEPIFREEESSLGWKHEQGEASMVRVRAVVLAVVFVRLAAVSLVASGKHLTLALESEGFTEEERVPLRVYLTEATGRPVDLVVFDSYNEVVTCLEDGFCDFAYLGALTYVRSHASHGVVALVQRTADLQLHALFITGAGSSIHSLRDLKGKQFAYSDINSTSGHLIPYHELVAAGINPEKDLITRYSGSHPVTAALVESGVVDAGALDETVFNSLVKRRTVHGDRVRVFYTSPPFVGNVYVARRDVPRVERDKFARALLALKEGRTIASCGFSSPRVLSRPATRNTQTSVRSSGN